MTSVKFEYTWTKPEIFSFFWRSRFVRLEALCTVLVLLSGVLVGGGFLAFAISYTAFMAIFFLWFIPSRAWKAIEEKGTITATVDDDGVATATSTVSSRVAWSEFPRSSETQEYFELHRRKKQLALMRLPKRGLASPEDEATLRELLTTHTTNFAKA